MAGSRIIDLVSWTVSMGKRMIWQVPGSRNQLLSGLMDLSKLHQMREKKLIYKDLSSTK